MDDKLTEALNGYSDKLYERAVKAIEDGRFACGKRWIDHSGPVYQVRGVSFDEKAEWGIERKQCGAVDRHIWALTHAMTSECVYADKGKACEAVARNARAMAERYEAMATNRPTPGHPPAGSG